MLYNFPNANQILSGCGFKVITAEHRIQYLMLKFVGNWIKHLFDNFAHSNCSVLGAGAFLRLWSQTR